MNLNDILDNIPGNRAVFEALVIWLRERKALAFVGAGASGGLYPMWNRFIADLADHAVAEGMVDRDTAEAWKADIASAPQARVDRIKAEIEEARYRAFLKRTFQAKKGGDGRAYTATHASLIRLPFRGYVTTNYDSGLDFARKELRPGTLSDGTPTWRDEDEVVRWRTGDIFSDGGGGCPILWLHGHWQRADSIVLNTAEYSEAYTPGLYQETLRELWVRERLIFVGFGFSDPQFEAMAREFLKVLKGAHDMPRHIALLSIAAEESRDFGKVKAARRRYEKEYHVRPLFFPTDKATGYQALTVLLAALEAATLGPVAATPPVMEPPPPPRAEPRPEPVPIPPRSEPVPSVEVPPRVSPGVASKLTGGGSRAFKVILAILAAFVVGVLIIGALRDETPPVDPSRPQPVVAGPLVFTVEPADAEARYALDGAASLQAMVAGRAELPSLAFGKHHLRVEAPGFFPRAVEFIHSAKIASAGLKVSLEKGAKVTVAARPGTQVSAWDERGKQTDLGAVPPGGRLEPDTLLQPGIYRIALQHIDCEPAEQKGVVLSGDRVPHVQVPQVPRPASLRVRTEPPGAVVWVDGIEAGKEPGPLLSSLPSERELVLEFRLPGYRTAQRKVTLAAREQQDLKEVVRLEREEGAVVFEVVGPPRGTEAEAFEVKTEASALLVDPSSVFPKLVYRGVAVGRHALTLAHPDYEPWTGPVEVRDGQNTEVKVDLKPRPGTVEFVTTPPGARVVVNGGALKDARFTVERPITGDYIVKAGDTGYKIAVALHSSAGLLVDANPDVSFGSLKVGQRLKIPPNAVDKVELQTPFTGSLPPGAYTVRYELAGYKSKELPFTAAANRVTKLPPTVLEGDDIKISDLKLTLKAIKAGSFDMGNTGTYAWDEYSKAEKPITPVTLSAFWLGETEVTQAQWRAVMGNTVAQQRDKAKATWLAGEGDDLPMYFVSWEEAAAFCEKLTERERAAGRLPAGIVYRLPTEAEWEYACRAGRKSDYNDGSPCTVPEGKDPALEKLVWYKGNSGSGTHPVGQRPANAWGLHDMHGNLWEWCGDRYGWYGGTAVTDPTGPENGDFRVVRGGGWFSDARDCRSASRIGFHPGRRDGYLGFRLAAGQELKSEAGGR